MKYPIIIQKDWSELTLGIAQANLANRKVFIITDQNVADLYLADIKATLAADIPHIILPAGEAEKNLTNIAALLSAFQQAGLDRSSVIIALGGGVVSDIAGFAASIYMRGISYISLPTTLLAMADSSIGGKTGIDFNDTKNLVGSFHNPSLVYINIATLKTLDTAQYISGLAEVIKYGIILDEGLFEYISDNRSDIDAREPVALDKIIRASIRIKSEVVTADEKEAGPRQVLNYGHTFGHAIESLCNFSLPHGHCVALGMVCAANFSRDIGKMSMFHVERIHSLLKFFDLPTKLPAKFNMTADDIYGMMLKDKKARDGALTLIISHKIGTVEIIKDVKKEEVITAIKSIL